MVDVLCLHHHHAPRHCHRARPFLSRPSSSRLTCFSGARAGHWRAKLFQPQRPIHHLGHRHTRQHRSRHLAVRRRRPAAGGRVADGRLAPSQPKEGGRGRKLAVLGPLLYECDRQMGLIACGVAARKTKAFRPSTKERVCLIRGIWLGKKGFSITKQVHSQECQ